MSEELKDISISGDEGLNDAITKATKELRAQLAAKDTELAAKSGQLDQATRIALERDKAARQAQAEAQRTAAYVTRTEYSALTNALAAADAEKQNLNSAMALAIETADGKKAAELNEKIADLAARRLVLEQGKDRLEEHIKANQAAANKPQPQRQQQQRPPVPPAAPIDPFEATIAQLPEPQKAWLRQHKDKGYVIPGQKPKPDLLIAYHQAEKAGHKENSPEFFAYMDKQLGHTSDEEPADASERFVEVPAEAPRQQARQAPQQSQGNKRPVTAAPVSRETSGSSRTGSKSYRLTADQAQTAERMGMTHAEYVAGIQEGIRRGKIPSSALQ